MLKRIVMTAATILALGLGVVETERESEPHANVAWILGSTGEIVGSCFMPALSLEWTLKTSGDYNADGVVDHVWQQKTGTTTQIVMWIMQDPCTIGEQRLMAAYTDPAWSAVGGAANIVIVRHDHRP